MNSLEAQPGIRRGFLLALGIVVLLILALSYLLRFKPAAPSSTAASPPAGINVAPVEAALTVVSETPADRIPPATLADKLGLEVASIRLSAAGRALDVRYRVLDQGKALSLDTRENMAYLVDQATGARVGPAQPPPPLELHKPTNGRIYYVMFPNVGGVLESGSKVTLVVGQAHARDLTVE